MAKARADLILRQIAKRHAKDFFMTEVKDGPTWTASHLRLDAVAIKKSWTHACITGYEVKVERQDFLRDDKWPGYRSMCHRLYFACPEGLIKLEELPEDIGLIWYSSERDTIWTKRTAAFREIEIPWQMLYYVCICRLDSDRHPFFSDKRDFLEAWVKDKQERRFLGAFIGSKMAKEVEDLGEQVRDLRWRVEANSNAEQELRRAKEIMRKAGVRVGIDWLDDLEEVLNSKVPPHILNELEAIERSVQRIKRFCGVAQEPAV